MATGDLDRATLVAAYRSAHAAPPSRASRVLARLQAAGDYAAVINEPKRRGMRLLVVAAVAAAVLAIVALEALTGPPLTRLGRAAPQEALDGAAGVRTGAVASSSSKSAARRPAASVVPAELPPMPSIASAEMPVAEMPVAEMPVAEAGQGEDASAQRRMGPAGAAEPPPAIADPLSDPSAAPIPTEAALLDEAEAALARRGWVDARNALRRHRDAYPQGERAGERRVLELVVDCHLDGGAASGAASRVRARDLIARQPNAPHLGLVIEACQGDDVRVISPFD